MDKPADCVLRAIQITKVYGRAGIKKGKPGGECTVRAVDGVDLCLMRGEVLGLLGETGCGKSTLGRMLAGLEPPTSGSLDLEGRPVAALSRENRKALRRRLQMIFQNPYDTFDSRHRIQRILTGTLRLHGIGNGRGERVRRVSQALESAGLRPAENYLDRYPGELSGGQLQRISIIRSMLLNPGLIVADEPVSMLDMSVRADIVNMLGGLARERGTSVIFISHDIATASYICDSIAVMYLGQIVESGPAGEVLDFPAHPYTRVLLSNSPGADPREPFRPIHLKADLDSRSVNTGGCYFAPRCPEACKACHETPQQLLPVAGEKHFARCFRAAPGYQVPGGRQDPCAAAVV